MSGPPLDAPPLDALTHHLAECPPELLADPRVRGRGEVHTDALVFDVLQELGLELPVGQLSSFRGSSKKDRPRLRLIQVVCWLLHHPALRETSDGVRARKALAFLLGGMAPLVPLVEAKRCVTDPDRREELARLTLRALGLRPAGETAAQAADRLRRLDSVERARVLADTKAKRDRARKLREAMRKKRAQEAAARYMRE